MSTSGGGGIGNGGGRKGGGNEHVVEKVLNKRERNGRTEYLLKWKNFPESANSWEPEGNLNCPELLAQFELAYSSVVLGLHHQGREREQSCRGSNEPMVHLLDDDDDKGTSRGSGGTGQQGPVKREMREEAEYILGACKANGTIQFLVKLRGRDVGQLVPSRVARRKFPQLVIDYYEKRFVWGD
jgi:hypothetical protein